jgi:hypothetical protein
MNTKTKIVLTSAAVILATGGLVSCSVKGNEPFKDAHVSSRNNSAAEVGTMPDGFSNWATKCDYGNRVYVIFKKDHTYGSIAVVAQDPTCKGQ